MQKGHSEHVFQRLRMTFFLYLQVCKKRLSHLAGQISARTLILRIFKHGLGIVILYQFAQKHKHRAV